MPGSIVLASLRFASVTVNDRTRWNFAEIGDDEGLTAVVETTSGGDVVSRLTPLVQALIGRPIRDETDVARIAGLGHNQVTQDFAVATAVSALRTAIVDIQAQRDGLSLTQALGGQPVESVELYANTNRLLLTTDRRPRDFAAVAERASRDGFRTIKCTPFDEVDPGDPSANLLELARPGLDRLAAVRSAIGPGVTLLVDCHSRFDLCSALDVAEELAKLDVGWFEEPVNPERDPEALAEIAARVSMPVAGGEHAYGAEFFRRLVAARAVDVAMPDIKHCGGVLEAVRAATLVARRGGQTSLHGPSGPVSILAGAHVTAALPAALPREFGAF
ncbi:MAG: mandelate racemase/muconate lactonizing enzyme family protein, partial [Chloroflexi bacterium]|nr:mandelate racemase/muconate lactonizing enzyme family protein [Chloroflexota bacterium]